MNESEFILLEDENLPQISFLEYRELTEGFINFLPSDTDKKSAHSKEVFAMIHKAYADQGGIKGSGFDSPDDMVKNIPFWKLRKSGGKITSIVMYKDSGGRKRVAAATDGTETGKKHAADMMLADLKMQRSYGEMSGKSLSFAKKNVDLKQHLALFDDAKNFHASQGRVVTKPLDTDPEVMRHPEFKENMYSRKIGDHTHTKVMMGARNKEIKESVTRTKEQEIANGASGSLKPGVYNYGNWSMDTQIHGPSQAHDRQPKWTSDDWHDMLKKSHEALTNPTKHISKPARLTHDAVLVYSKKRQQGVVLRIAPKDRNNLKQGGSTRIETILPQKSSIAKEGTQRIVIEGIEFDLGVNFYIID